MAVIIDGVLSAGFLHSVSSPIVEELHIYRNDFSNFSQGFCQIAADIQLVRFFTRKIHFM